MYKPKQLAGIDFMDTYEDFDGETTKDIPELTQCNFLTLIDSHNNLVEVVNALVDIKNIESKPQYCIVFEDE